LPTKAKTSCSIQTLTESFQSAFFIMTLVIALVKSANL